MDIPGDVPVAFTYTAYGETVSIRSESDGSFAIDDGCIRWFTKVSTVAESAQVADEMCREKKAHRELLEAANKIHVRWVMRDWEKAPAVGAVDV